jgi:hypothetical protein
MLGIQTPRVATVHNGQSRPGPGSTPSSWELAAELRPVGPHWPRAYPARCSVSTTTEPTGQSIKLSPARCAGECGLCEACVRRLPLALVQLMAQSRHVLPGLFATAVKCSRMWLRAHPANAAGDAR